MKNSLLLALFTIICFPVFIAAHTFDDPVKGSTNYDVECAINILISGGQGCIDDNTYEIEFELGIDSDCNNDSLSVFINEEFKGDFSSDYGYLHLRNLNSNSPGPNDQLKVCIKDNPAICKTIDYPKPNCGPDTCRIGEVMIKYDCSSNDELYVEIGIPNNESEGFITYDLYIDGQHQYTYSGYSYPSPLNYDWKVLFLEAGIEYTYLIVDSKNDKCFASGTIYNDCVPIDNSCRIENIEVLSTSCNINGSFDMEVDYDYQNEPNYYVDVLLNGEHHSVHGINGKVNLKFIPHSQNNETNTITICAHETPDCCTTIEYVQPVCEIISECLIGEIEVTNECIFNGYYESFIDFAEETKVILDLYVDNAIYRSVYVGRTRVSMGKFINGTAHTYRLLEREDENCAVEGDIFSQECTEDTQPCPEILIKLDSAVCNFDGTYWVSMVTRFDNISNQFPTVSVNGEEAEYHSNSNPEIKVTPNPDSEFDYFELCLDENRTCCKTIEFKQPECLDTQQCRIDAEIRYGCWNNQYASYLSSLGDFVEGVDVFIDGELKKSFNHVLSINNYHLGWNDLGEYQTLKIVSHLDETCIFEEVYGISDCSEANPAPHVSVELENIVCKEDGNYDLSISHDFFENGFDCLDFYFGYQNGVQNITLSDYYQTIMEPGNINLTNINLDASHESYFVTLSPIGSSNASQTINFQLPNCREEVNTCKIEIHDVNWACIEENTDHIFLQLDITTNIDAHQVFVNNKLILEANSIEQLLGVIPVEKNSTGNYNIVVTSVNEADCTAEFSLMQAICPSVCAIEGIEVYNIDCTNDNAYSMSVNFQLTNNLNIPFTFYLNGEIMDTFNGSSLPLDLTDLAPSDSNSLEVITICLDELNECCFDFTFDTPNCLTNAVDKTLIEGVTISPNPTIDIININHIPNEVIGLNIVDNLGRSMIQINTQADMQFDVSNYPEGIYTVQFFTVDNKVMSLRFIKMN